MCDKIRFLIRADHARLKSIKVSDDIVILSFCTSCHAARAYCKVGVIRTGASS